ncbi:MAG: septum formation initiator family protein [Rhodospirillaceae bacterium]
MSIARHFQRAARLIVGRTVGPVLWLGVIGYFSFYAVHGERGLLSMRQLQTEVEQSRGALAVARDERQRLDRRTKLLRSDSLDLDMLDERVREMLNKSRAADVIIMLPPRRDGNSGAKSRSVN